MSEKKPKREQKAVALQYKPEDVAPRVVASGQGYVAEKILETAAREDVRIHKDAKLAEELTKVELGANIPPELYEIVAKILVFIEGLDKLEAKVKNGK